jgi:hypothetical protein
MRAWIFQTRMTNPSKIDLAAGDQGWDFPSSWPKSLPPTALVFGTSTLMRS